MPAEPTLEGARLRPAVTLAPAARAIMNLVVGYGCLQRDWAVGGCQSPELRRQADLAYEAVEKAVIELAQAGDAKMKSLSSSGL